MRMELMREMEEARVDGGTLVAWWMRWRRRFESIRAILTSDSFIVIGITINTGRPIGRGIVLVKQDTMTKFVMEKCSRQITARLAAQCATDRAVADLARRLREVDGEIAFVEDQPRG